MPSKIIAAILLMVFVALPLAACAPAATASAPTQPTEVLPVPTAAAPAATEPPVAEIAPTEPPVQELVQNEQADGQYIGTFLTDICPQISHWTSNGEGYTYIVLMIKPTVYDIRLLVYEVGTFTIDPATVVSEVWQCPNLEYANALADERAAKMEELDSTNQLNVYNRNGDLVVDD